MDAIAAHTLPRVQMWFFNKQKHAHKPSIYCDAESWNARRLFAEWDTVVITKQPENADLLWMREDYEPFLNGLSEDQALNHLPNEAQITNKGLLTEQLQRYDGSQSGSALALKDFYQETYCLYREDQREQFFAQLPSEPDKDNLWIVKPVNLSRGRGVEVLWQFDELKEELENPEETPFDPIDLIIQRYIKNPLLLNGRKSEIRLYWLIASLDPLLVFLYREGTARLNTLPFSLGDFDNPLVHVTNVYQQQNHPDYDPDAVLKWTFADLDTYVSDEGGASFVEERLMPQLKKYIEFVVMAARDSLVECPERGLFFGLYGADIIVDDTLHPWLTEIQEGPGLSFSDPVKKRVIPAMLGEAIEIVLEVQKRSRNGEPLTDLEAPDGFERVIDEAQ